jgi:hypothetical protein
LKKKKSKDSDSDDSDSESDEEMDVHEYRKFLSKIFPSKNLDKKIKEGEKLKKSSKKYESESDSDLDLDFDVFDKSTISKEEIIENAQANFNEYIVPVILLAANVIDGAAGFPFLTYYQNLRYP